MCEKHPWKSDILSKNRGRLTAALFKMALFHWCFAYILPVKINSIVSPYKKHRPQMSYCNPWCHTVLKYSNVYIYITVYFIIFIFWKLSLLFSESLLCRNPGLRKLVRLKGCSDVITGCGCTNLFIWYSNID